MERDSIAVRQKESALGHSPHDVSTFQGERHQLPPGGVSGPRQSDFRHSQFALPSRSSSLSTSTRPNGLWPAEVVSDSHRSGDDPYSLDPAHSSSIPTVCEDTAKSSSSPIMQKMDSPNESRSFSHQDSAPGPSLHRFEQQATPGDSGAGANTESASGSTTRALSASNPPSAGGSSFGDVPSAHHSPAHFAKAFPSQSSPANSKDVLTPSSPSRPRGKAHAPNRYRSREGADLRQEGSASGQERGIAKADPHYGHWPSFMIHRTSQPQLSTQGATRSPASAMYFSRLPCHGDRPGQALRAHTGTLVGDRIWFIGGVDSKNCWRKVAWLDTESLQWTILPTSGDTLPPLRAHTTNLVGDKLFIFGGGDGPTYSNDVWILDTGE